MPSADSENTEVRVLLENLRCDNPQLAWRAFLTSYAAVITSVAKQFVRDRDEVGDCFVYVCEKLAEKDYKRLLSFKSDGKARFSTWLRAVTRNLCLDWLRANYGRQQVFRPIASMATLDQEIFKAFRRSGMSLQATWCDLSSRGVEISYSEFERRASGIQKLLTARQLWLLSTTNVVFDQLETVDAKPGAELADPSPNPESTAVLNDISKVVNGALQELTEEDRLLLRMRFWQDLGLAEIGGLVGLKDAQTVDRRIRAALEVLRKKLNLPSAVAGKRKSVSV